jgi:hypothetical protein
MPCVAPIPSGVGSPDTRPAEVDGSAISLRRSQKC